MNDADAVIETLEKLPEAEKQRVHEYLVTRDNDEELREKVREGLEDIKQGNTVDGEEAFDRLQKLAENLASGK